MHPEWSALNKQMQKELHKETTYRQGMETLFLLRKKLMGELLRMKDTLCRTDFNAMPFPNAQGYHSKTIAYSVWHIFRIEDIVVNSLVLSQRAVLDDFLSKIGAPIITTGNELSGQQIVNFSSALDLDALYAYARAVKDGTEALLRQLSYRDLKRTFDDADRQRLRALQVVSTDENACWLIDYWCGKDVRGLIQMPFSRHWIMHIEASIRIENKLRSRRENKCTSECRTKAKCRQWIP